MTGVHGPMSEPVYSKTLDEYLGHVVREVGKYGRDGLEAVALPEALATGFSSPEGKWLLGMNVLKAAFPCEPRRNTNVENYYYAAGGQTPIVTMTTVAPHHEVVAGFKEKLEAAIAEGERVFALRGMN